MIKPEVFDRIEPELFNRIEFPAEDCRLKSVGFVSGPAIAFGDRIRVGFSSQDPRMDDELANIVLTCGCICFTPNALIVTTFEAHGGLRSVLPPTVPAFDYVIAVSSDLVSTYFCVSNQLYHSDFAS